jgi:hypothetical protein
MVSVPAANAPCTPAGESSIARHSPGLTPSSQLARRQKVHLGVGLAVLDVFAGDDGVELVREPQDLQHAKRLLAVGLGGERRRITLAPDVTKQGYVMRVAVFEDEFRVGQQLLVDAEPYPDEGLPRRVHAEL